MGAAMGNPGRARRIGTDRGCAAPVAQIIDEDASGALALISQRHIPICVACGEASSSRFAQSWAASCVMRFGSGATTWRPLPPVVLGQLSSPSRWGSRRIATDFRGDPGRLWLADRFIQWRRIADQSIQALAHHTRFLLGETALHFAGIEQAAIVPPADIERRHPARICTELFDKGYDGERRAFAAFYLQPGLLPARAVGRVAPLRDESLEAHFARLPIDLIRVGLEMIGVEKTTRHFCH